MSRSRDLANRTIADDAVTLAKMASGTDGQIITYDASGNPSAVGPGTDGQVLTSTGSGSPPAFEGLPISVAVICDEKAYNADGGSSATSWTHRDLNTKLSDLDSIVTVSSNQFTLGAGTFWFQWSTGTMKASRYTSRIINVTDTDATSGNDYNENGASHTYYSSGEHAYDSAVSTRTLGSAVVAITGTKVFEVQTIVQDAQATYGFVYSQSTSGTGTPSIYTIVSIFKLK